MTTSTIVSVQNVSKRFVLHQHRSVKERIVDFRTANRHKHEFWALRDINLDIPLGSTVGLIGHNGSGKSTLLKVIGGIIEPTVGSVSRRGRMAALLELGAGFHPDLSGRENVYLNASILGLTRKETDFYFDAIVDFSGIESFIDTQVKFYSSGMYVRLAFAVAVHVDPDLLLVDEVLAVGDEPFQKKCMDKIAEFQAEGRTIVVVSHSAGQVGQLCDRVLVLDHGVVMHDGDPSEGIRILRDGYEHERVAAAEEAAAKSSSATSASPVSIVSVIADTEEGATGTNVTVTVVADVKRPLEDWGIGFGIESTLGTAIYQVDTFDEKIALPSTVGRHVLTTTFPDLRLGVGKYLINVGLGSSVGVEFDAIRGAASFDAPNSKHGAGILRVSPQFEVDSASINA